MIDPSGDRIREDRTLVNAPSSAAIQDQIRSMGWRIDRLGPGSPEAFEALEETMEELKVVVEELRVANEALEESRSLVESERARYRDLFELAPDAYLVTDLLGIIREVNHATSAQLNISQHFLIGKPLLVFLPEEGRSAFRSELNRLREEVGTREYDIRLQPRGFLPFDATIRVCVIRDPISGQPEGLRWMVRDVSARKRAEEKIRALNSQLERRVVERSEMLESMLETNERWLIKVHAADTDARAEGDLFRDLVEEVDAILWRADAADGRYTFVSRRAEDLLGYPAARWLEDPGFWLERVHPDDRDFVTATRRKNVQEGLDHQLEYRVLALDGRAIWFRESVRVLKGDDGRPSDLCGLMVNISRRKKIERQLYSMKGELDSRLRDMVYLHELVDRLSEVRGLAAVLDEVLTGVSSLLGADQAMIHLSGRHGTDSDLLARLPDGPFDFDPLPFLDRQSVEDIRLDPDLAAAIPEAVRGLFVVPLSGRDDEALGTIFAFFPVPHRPPARQTALVEIYARRAADAIELAQLRETHQDRCK